MHRTTLSVREAAQVLGVSRGHLYALLRRGELKGIRLGRRVVVPVEVLEALLGHPLDPEGLEAPEKKARRGGAGV